MATEYLCNLVIPGAGKSGTSSLHDLLGQHPDICMSKPKEPQFFSFSDRYAAGAVWHNCLFEHRRETARIFGESSQCYFAHERAVNRISESLEAPKIILLLRDPIKRLLSQYSWSCKLGLEVETLADAVRSRGESVEYNFDERIGMYREEGGYVAFSRYSSWVPVWKKRFGVENVLVLRFEDFIADQAAVARRCFDFLGVTPLEEISPACANTTEQTTTVIVPAFYSKFAGFLPKWLKNSDFYRNTRQAIKRRLTPAPNLMMNETLRRELEVKLGSDIAFHGKLEKL